MPVGLGGGGVGDARAPKLVRGPTALAASFAADAPENVHGLAGWRTIVYYLELTAAPGAPMSARARVYWLIDENGSAVTDGFSSVRRDSLQNLVVDEPLIPVVPANTVLRVIIPLANPGGALAVALGLEDATLGGGSVTQWVSAES